MRNARSNLRVPIGLGPGRGRRGGGGLAPANASLASLFALRARACWRRAAATRFGFFGRVPLFSTNPVRVRAFKMLNGWSPNLLMDFCRKTAVGLPNYWPVETGCGTRRDQNTWRSVFTSASLPTRDGIRQRFDKLTLRRPLVRLSHARSYGAPIANFAAAGLPWPCVRLFDGEAQPERPADGSLRNADLFSGALRSFSLQKYGSLVRSRGNRSRTLKDRASGRRMFHGRDARRKRIAAFVF
jgi:hypothetical protein